MTTTSIPTNLAPVLSDDLIGEFERVGMALKKPKGSLLFRQGDPANGVFVLRNGRALLTLTSAQGRVLSARELGHGAVLGLPATMSGRPYSLTATLLQDSEVVHIGAERLRDLLRENTEICFQVVQVLGRELTLMRNIAAAMTA